MGKIPRDLFEDELVPLFEKAGPIWDLRLMMDPLSGLNRGYAFLTFCTKEAAQEAVKLVRQRNPYRSIHSVYSPSTFKYQCMAKVQLGSDSHGCCFASESLKMQQLFKYSIPVFLLSV